MRTLRKAALFDLYGTLADVKVDERNETFWNTLISCSILKNCGLTARQLEDLFFTIAKEEAENGGEEGLVLSATFARLLSDCGVASDQTTIRSFAHSFRKESIVFLREKSYARFVLNATRAAGCRLGLISNTEALLTDYDLEQLKLRPLFDLVLLSSEVGTKKPDRRIFEKALQELEVKNSEAIFVGDDLNADVFGALDAGLDVVFITNMPRQVPLIGNQKESTVIQSPPEREKIIEALRGVGLDIPVIFDHGVHYSTVDNLHCG